MSSDPIAYTYEADVHCVPCALDRFGREPGRTWVREDARDAEGNSVGVIATWDAWCDPDETGQVSLICGTCGWPITSHYHE